MLLSSLYSTERSHVMSLFRHELYKTCTRFNLILIAVLFTANLLITAVQTGAYWRDSREVRDTVDALLYEYNNNRTDYNAYYEDYEERRRASMFEGQPFENRLIDLDSYGEVQLFDDVAPIVERSEKYGRDVAKVVDAALKRLSDPDVKKGSYVYEYQAQLVLHYRPLCEQEIPAAVQFGWNEYFSMRAPTILLAVASLAVFSGGWLGEKRNRIVNVLRVSKRGGAPLVWAKLASTALVSVCLTLLFELSPLTVLAVTRGLSSLSIPIQSLNLFEFCPFILSVGQYLFLVLLVQIGLFILFDLFVLFLGQILPGELPVFGFMLILLTGSFWISGRQTDSALYGFRALNFVDLTAGDFLFIRYRALNCGGLFLGLYPTLIVLGIAFLGLLVGLPFAVGLKADRYQRIKLRIPVQIKRCTEHNNTVRSLSLSIFRYELGKSILSPISICLLLLALTAKFLVSASYFEPPQGMYWDVYEHYMSVLRGPVTEGKITAVVNEERYVSRCFRDYALATDAFRNGEMTDDEYQEIRERRNYADLVEKPLESIRERLNYLSGPSAEEYDNIEFLDERGIMKLFCQPLDYILILLLTILFSDIFIREYRTGFKSILHIQKNGGAQTWRGKWAAALVGTVVVWLLFFLIDVWHLSKSSDMTLFSAGLMSIPEMKDTRLNVSIGQYFAGFELIRLFGSIALSAVIVGLSTLTYRLTIQLPIVFVVLFTPSLVTMLGVKGLEVVSIATVLAPTSLQNIEFSLVGWSVFGAILITISEKVWRESKIRYS